MSLEKVDDQKNSLILPLLLAGGSHPTLWVGYLRFPSLIQYEMINVLIKSNGYSLGSNL